MNYSIKTDEERIYVYLSGKITAQDLDTLKADFAELTKQYSDREWIMECSKLKYISSGGLRWILGLQQNLPKKISFTGVQPGVFDIFTQTGFRKLFNIERGLREISVKGCELIGRGANGEVYRLKDETIVKAFMPGVDLLSVEKEEAVSHTVFESGLPAVIPYDTVRIAGGRFGIVFETLNSKTLSETIEEDPERFDEWIAKYVDLYRMMHEKDGSDYMLPLAKDVYRRHLMESADWYSEEEMDKLMRLLESIPDRNTMVHGDYHPNNIMVSDGELIMIDLGDFSVGHPVFDFLATAATQANLVELSPEYAEFHTKMKAERIKKGWSELIRQYFPDRTPEERSRIDAQIRLFSKLKVACAPAVAKGIPEKLMRDSVNDAKENLIPRIEELIGAIDW